MALALEESAREAGRRCWMERRLFEILGAWVGATPEPEARMLLDRHSQHHAWRAGQWWERLPVLADVERDLLCSPPDGPLPSALDRLATVEGTVRRLVCAYRVVMPRMWALYERHRLAADPLADSSTLRTLSMVMADLASDWREGEVVLQGLIDRLVIDHGPIEGRTTLDQAARLAAGLEADFFDGRG